MGNLPARGEAETRSRRCSDLGSPSGYRYSIAHLSNVLRSRPAEKQVYRVRERGKQTIWEWVATDVALDPETDEPWPDTYLLHSLLVRDGPSDDGSDDYYEDEEAPIRNALIFDSPFEVAARESRYKQDLLQQYERELLGTDLLDLHKHQSDLAVERLRLSEASAMLDTEEYVLHQYETELLGLDLIARDLREGLKELLSFIDMSDVSGN